LCKKDYTWGQALREEKIKDKPGLPGNFFVEGQLPMEQNVTADFSAVCSLEFFKHDFHDSSITIQAQLQMAQEICISSKDYTELRCHWNHLIA